MRARRQRMIFAGVVVGGVAFAATLVFLALGENMLYFFSPTQLNEGAAGPGQEIRVGGLVVAGSVERGQGTEVRFRLTDQREEIEVSYTGMLPDLFREGQGIVARGRVLPGGRFAADEVLAKHDENYMPPDVAAALEMAAEGGQTTTVGAMP